MTRTRSPNYPSISLPEAIERVKMVFEKEHRHLSPKEVVMKAMGYGGVNGASLGALSALRKYGLLERQDKNYRVTDRALAILHPENQLEKAEAIRAAAFAPGLFDEISKAFPGRPPSDENLRAYLIRRDFLPTALTPLIQAFRETIALVSPESGDYSSPPKKETEQPMNLEQADLPGSATLRRKIAAAEVDPARSLMKVSFTGDAVEISGRALDQDTIDQLLKALSAMRPLLPAKKLETAEDSQNVEDII